MGRLVRRAVRSAIQIAFRASRDGGWAGDKRAAGYRWAGRCRLGGGGWAHTWVRPYGLSAGIRTRRGDALPEDERAGAHRWAGRWPLGGGGWADTWIRSYRLGAGINTRTDDALPEDERAGGHRWEGRCRLGGGSWADTWIRPYSHVLSVETRAPTVLVGRGLVPRRPAAALNPRPGYLSQPSGEGRALALPGIGNPRAGSAWPRPWVANGGQADTRVRPHVPAAAIETRTGDLSGGSMQRGRHPLCRGARGVPPRFFKFRWVGGRERRARGNESGSTTSRRC